MSKYLAFMYIVITSFASYALADDFVNPEYVTVERVRETYFCRDSTGYVVASLKVTNKHRFFVNGNELAKVKDGFRFNGYFTYFIRENNNSGNFKLNLPFENGTPCYLYCFVPSK